MPKLASQYPYDAVTVRKTKLMPGSISLPADHSVIVTSETENFGRVVTEVDGKPRSGFLPREDYRKT